MDSVKQDRNIATTIASESTKFYADSVEWCPLKPFQDFFVCGTYQMEDDSAASTEHPQTRKGDVTLYQLSKNLHTFEKYVLESKTNINCSGVLDMKWAPHYVNNKCTFGVAFSDGYVQLQQLSCSKENSIALTKLSEVNIATDDGSLALSLDWSSWKHEIAPENIIVSDSSGSLNIVGLSSAGLNLKKKWKAHDFEAWIATFDYDHINIIFSGGDDCFLKSWDLRTDLSSPIFINKSHAMGVTSALKSRKNEYLLATGSYDEYVRMWDTRKMKCPLYEVHVKGGVWRVKWHPYSLNYLLVAAMHGGFHVLHLDGISCAAVAASYNEHTSLAYGVDWCWLLEKPIDILEDDVTALSNEINDAKNTNEEGAESIVASCSFYDRSLRLWSVQLPCLK